MALPVMLQKHKGFVLGALALGGFGAFQVFGGGTPAQVRPAPKDDRVVRASVDDRLTLHGQVDELKAQVGTLVESLTGVSKDLRGVKQSLSASQEARLQDQAQATREREQAKAQEQRLREELSREREQREKDARAASARVVAKAEPAAVPPSTPPPSRFALRTIGSSKDRPKTAPSPLAQHVDTAYLPAGCFAKVRLVTGVSATSQLGGGGGASWGHPILYVIREPFDCARKLDEIGLAALRQRTRVPLDGCLGFATGKADLASSRVQGEGTLLSCVMPDGEAYEVPMKGYLVGADGVQGIVGEVQSHESAKVGKAFLAGMIEEAAAFFSQARKGVTISVTGQSVPYGGMETTLRKIADYWLEQARALQPTLFVPSNTEAYLVILQGVPLEGMHRVNWLKTGVL